MGTYDDFRLGRSLGKELAACLLGGHGMPAELGLAAYRRLRNRGLLRAIPTETALEAALSEPFSTARGASRHYRFPRQKARYLAGCLEALRSINPPDGDVALRTRLLELPGIGPKTASWIVRNHRGSDRVAIIDIHILRAGRHVGLFPSSWQPPRDYFRLEAAFLELAAALKVRASLLDALIWDYMRRLPPVPAPAAVERPATP